MRRLLFSIYALILVDEVLLLALVPLAPTYRDELGLSKTETGALLGASGFATVFISIPAGILADRIGARRLTIAAGFLLALAGLVQGLADEFWQLIAARIAFGAASATIWTAGSAWLSDSVPARRRSAALGAIMAVAGIGTMIGPVFAGFLAEHAGLGAPFYAAAAAAAAVTVGLVLSGPGRSAAHGHQPILETVRAVRGERLVLGALAVMVVCGLSDGVVALLAPLQLDHNGISPGAIGAVFSIGAAVYLVGSVAVTRLGDSAARLGIAGAGALALALSFLPVLVSSSTAAIVTVVLLRAPFVALLYTICFPLGANGAHRAGVGRGAAIGLLNVGWGSASLVAPLAAGAVAQVSSERIAYAAFVALALAAGAWLVALRARTAVPDPHVGG